MTPSSITQGIRSSSGLSDHFCSNAENENFSREELNSFNSEIRQIDISEQVRICTSSAKSGHPAENLRVCRLDDVNKLWQSDSITPHFITLEADSPILLSELRFYIDFKSDESYTPKTVVIQLGSSLDTLTDFSTVDCDGSQGWVCIDFCGALIVPSSQQEIPDFIRASIVRLVITSNNQMGRDSRVRGIRLFAPFPSPQYHHTCDSLIEKFILKRK